MSGFDDKMTLPPRNPEGTPPTSADPAAGPSSFGAYLSAERHLRNIALEDISKATRIAEANLRALEQDDTARLPGRVFVIGYIKAYAKYLGLNEEETVLRYDQSLHKDDAPPALSAAPAPQAKKAKSGTVGDSLLWDLTDRLDDKVPVALSLALLVFAVVLCLGVGSEDDAALESSQEEAPSGQVQGLSTGVSPSATSEATGRDVPRTGR